MTWRGWEQFVPSAIDEATGKALKPKSPSKYRNRKTTVDGITFDSAKEARRWTELKMLERAGQIAKLQRQRRYPLTVGVEHIGDYVSDFTYYEHAGIVEVVEDVKSPASKTPLYRWKKKHLRAQYGIVVREV